MRNKKAEFDWEALPWGYDDDEDANYAIYIDRGENWHHNLPFGYPALTISNQMECAETFSLRTVEELDAFVARLTKARVWLSEKEIVVSKTADWQTIQTAPYHVQDAAAVCLTEPGRSRARIYHGPELSLYALWTGGDIGTPATLWCQLPDVPYGKDE